jgi:sarcosine oxidase
MSEREHVVVGGGLAGLAAAWHLARAGVRDVLVLEARSPGHDGGSSHGRSRMVRSTYGSSTYVQLVQDGLRRDWPELSAHAGQPLIQPRPAVFFGPRGGLFDGFREATLGQRLAGLTDLPLAEARRRFPMLRFGPEDTALLDETAGVISAALTIQALRRAAVDEGVSIETGAAVERIDREGRALVLHRADGEAVAAARVLVAAGAHTPGLVPELESVITPLRQVVGYAVSGELTAVPCWARLDAHGLVYGLPPHLGDGAKVAGHRLRGPPDDPDAIAPIGPGDRMALLQAVGPALVDPPSLARMETCLYAVTASEDPVIAQLPHDPRVAVLAGLSGHGFKLGPIFGRIAAQVALGRPTGVAAFDQARARFGVSR